MNRGGKTKKKAQQRQGLGRLIEKDQAKGRKVQPSSEHGHVRL